MSGEEVSKFTNIDKWISETKFVAKKKFCWSIEPTDFREWKVKSLALCQLYHPIQQIRHVSNLPYYVLKRQKWVGFGTCFLRSPPPPWIFHFILVICSCTDYTLSMHKGFPHSVSPSSDSLLLSTVWACILCLCCDSHIETLVGTEYQIW